MRSLAAQKIRQARIVAARRELAEVLRLIGELPARCRQVVHLRKIDGLSQNEISLRLGITKTMVENDVVKGMRLISGALKESGAVDVVRRTLRIHGQARLRKRDR